MKLEKTLQIFLQKVGYISVIFTYFSWISTEYATLDSQLDEMNSALDDIEQKNDDIHAKLLELLNANREIRQQLQNSASAPATDENASK